MSTKSNGPLAGLRILDIGRIMAAPWATQIFADLGAEVIKIERPDTGDDTRSWGPPFAKTANGEPSKESGYFLCVNRGKKSVVVDIASVEGQSVIHELTKISDVVIENFRPGGLKKHKLDYDTLNSINPKIIYCSLTGFGQDGPRRNQAAYDFATQAMGGLLSITGEADENPGGGPQKVGIPIIDLMSGMYAAVAVLAAINNRNVTGQGEYIDVAMLDVSAAIMANQAMNYFVGGQMPRRRGNSHPNIQPQDIYQCADGEFVLAVGNDTQFVKLCAALGKAAIASDQRFIKNSDRVQNLDDLRPILAGLFAQFSREKLLSLLAEAGVPAAPVNSIPEVFDEAQIKHRALLQYIDHPTIGKVPSVVSPMKFQNAPLEFKAAPPTLGQHTKEVLERLGMDGTD